MPWSEVLIIAGMSLVYENELELLQPLQVIIKSGIQGVQTMIHRIISLTPSITETLFALGAGTRIVGVTDTCDFPLEANALPHICSWFEPDTDRILNLQPDLVIGLETAHSNLEDTFKEHGIRLVLLNPAGVADALTDIIHFGRLLDLQPTAKKLVDGLQKRMGQLAKKVRQLPRTRLLTVSRVLDIEDDQLIVAGPRSFQFDVIACAGGLNVTGHIDLAYPKVSIEQFKQWNPEMVFICGSDRQHLSRIKADPSWQSLISVQQGRIYQFDCGLTCRTGPRIVDMAGLLYKTLYT